MAALSIEAKRYIVQALACFDTPSQVVKAIKADLGVDVSAQQVEAYDPNKKAGEKLSPKLKALFESSRAKFLDDTSQIPVSHKAVRLRRLDRMAQKAEEKGNLPLAAELLEQAAKECGDAFSNRQKLDHTSSDGSMAPRPAVVELVAPGDGKSTH